MQHFAVGPNVYVRSLAIDDKSGLLWVGTSVGALGVDLKAQQVKHTFTRKDGLANEYIFAIGVDPQGGIWFGTNAGGASLYKGGAWTTYFPMHGLADYWVYSFAFAKDDGVWIGTWNGANRFDPTTKTFGTYRDELINIWVYGLDIDENGRIWFGTEGGVSMFDGARWVSWTHDDGLGAPNTANLPSSMNSGLGTQNRHDLSVEIGGAETYNPNYVFAALVDRSGKGVWFGTWGGGLSFFDMKQGWTNYTTADGLAGNIVYSLAQSADGALWVGTNHGVSRFDGTSWSSYSHGLVGQNVYAVVVNGDNEVWLGTKGAVTSLTFGE
ncbi:MAG: two-component regulator propeller domain-containing protein [Hyphomicrobiaceae bacterium]